MDFWILNLIRKRFPTAPIRVGMGLVTILALMTVLAVGTAQAADNGAKGSGILLAAKDAHAADAAKKDDKASGGKEAAAKEDAKKASAASAPAKTAE